MTAFSIGFQFITGVMVGIELVPQEDILVIDVFIVRFIIEWETGSMA